MSISTTADVSSSTFRTFTENSLHLDPITGLAGMDNSHEPHNSVRIHYGVLLVIGCVGIMGNAAILLALLLHHRLRHCSSAHIFHHCCLDLLKSLHSIVLAHSALTGEAPPLCNVLGVCFILCVTSTAFNHLAMVMNEAYVFGDRCLDTENSANGCCVLFSISTIWFASIILNLGVAFLPGNPVYIGSVGVCLFEYGISRNYVLHVLWISLITLAVMLTAVYLRRLYRDLRNCHYAHIAESLPNVSRVVSLLPLPKEVSSVAASPPDPLKVALWKRHSRGTQRRLHRLMILVLLFIVAWYPLFMLTLADRKFHAPPLAYKCLLVFACLNSTLNPYVFWSLIAPNCAASSATSRSAGSSSAMQRRQPLQQQQQQQHCEMTLTSGMGGDREVFNRQKAAAGCTLQNDSTVEFGEVGRPNRLYRMETPVYKRPQQMASSAATLAASQCMTWKSVGQCVELEQVDKLMHQVLIPEQQQHTGIFNESYLRVDPVSPKQQSMTTARPRRPHRNAPQTMTGVPMTTVNKSANMTTSF